MEHWDSAPSGIAAALVVIVFFAIMVLSAIALLS